MARPEHRGDEAGLREYFLEQAVAFRELYGGVHPDAWVELSKPVNLLVSGEPYGLYRYDLPDDHPLRLAAGPVGMCDYLVLTEREELKAA